MQVIYYRAYDRLLNTLPDKKNQLLHYWYEKENDENH